jgi:hypothetical protein
VKNFGLALTFLCLAAIPAGAADLIEPWPVGLSNFELAVAAPPGGTPSASSVVGFGLLERLSLGFLFAAAEREETGARILLLYSQSLGGKGELDAWCEADLAEPSADPACGVEWSAAAGRLVPYARFTLARSEGSTAAVPMLGMMLPLSQNKLQLHLELSSEDAEFGERPWRVALGPNWAFTSRIELLPEVSWIYQRDGGSGLEIGLGVAIDMFR